MGLVFILLTIGGCYAHHKITSTPTRIDHNDGSYTNVYRNGSRYRHAKDGSLTDFVIANGEIPRGDLS